jgi:hypothetical protein
MFMVYWHVQDTEISERYRLKKDCQVVSVSHRIEIGQKLHSWVKNVPECQPTSGVAAMLKATKPEEIYRS